MYIGTSASRPQRFPVLVLGLLSFAAFGPYVAGNIRTEQIAVYGAALLLVPLTFFHARPCWQIAVPWFGLILVSLLGLIPPVSYTPTHEAGTLPAGVDSLALPLTVMALVWSIIPVGSAVRALSVVAAVVVWCTAANGLLSMVGTQVDLSAFLRPFWSGDVGETTAERAAQMGRLSGIFNQPAEAGVVYGVAGILAVWRYKHKPKLTLMLLALISIGGMLCVSKVFILGGIPLILIYLWKSRAGIGKVGLLFGAALVAAGIAQSGFFQEWTGFNYLARLVAPDQDQGLIEFYSAGRWNEEAGMMAVFDVVLDASPLYGFGLAGIQVPYDSAWTEAMVLAGILGAFLLGVVYWSIFRMARRQSAPDLRLMGTFLALFLAGASLGIPSLTINRASTIVWVVLALLCMTVVKPKRRTAQDQYARAALNATRV